MKALIVDNFDSYTFNLLQLCSQELALMDTGCRGSNGDSDHDQSEVVVIRNNQYSGQDVIDSILPYFDCVIISPGPGRPDRAEDFGLCADIIKAVQAGTVSCPVLGVCLGHQGIASIFGGNVIHATVPMHGRLSNVSWEHHEISKPQGLHLFEGIPSPFRVVRYHSLVVEPASLPESIRPTAWTTEEDGVTIVIMALEHKELPLWGVQFHPESICTEHGGTLLKNFLRLSKASNEKNHRVLPKLPEHIRSANVIPKPISIGSEFSKQNVHPQARTLYVAKLDYLPDPVSLFKATCASRDRFWLDTAKVEKDIGNYSFMGSCDSADSFCVQYSTESRIVTLKQPTPGGGIVESTQRLDDGQTFFNWVADTLDSSHNLSSNESMHVVHMDIGTDGKLSRRVSDTSDGLPFDFVGGMVGYFGYEMKCESIQPTVSATTKRRGYSFRMTSASQQHDGEEYSSTLGTPDACFISSSHTIAIDHVNKQLYMLALAPPGDLYHNSVPTETEAWLTSTASKIQSLRLHTTQTSPITYNPIATPTVKLAHSRDKYLSNVQQALDKIKDGETYEVCLTTHVLLDVPLQSDNEESKSRVEPLELYIKIRERNPAPHGAFLEFGEDLAILQSSPERFIQCSADGWVEMRPIKGTIARPSRPFRGGLNDAHDEAAWEEEDSRRRATLRGSEKDMAENLMIVDLIRNDLNQICDPATVTVPSLFEVRSYATVHQMISTIRGHLRKTSDDPKQPKLTCLDAIRATFPPGSMTGAPKLRTCQILEQLEGRGHARGPYSGCLGYISATGACDMSVVIRTAIVLPKKSEDGSSNGIRIAVGAGGAIVYLSDPVSEFEEMVLKAGSVVPSLLSSFNVPTNGSDLLLMLSS